MKKLFYILALFIGFCSSVYAQKAKLSKEEFRNIQEKFITEKANLTTKEAKQFFPLYFELQDRKTALNKEAWKKIRKVKEENVSESEYGQLIEDVIETRIQIDKLDLEYVRKYKKILSAKKIFEIQRAEMKFHRELLKPKKKKCNAFLFLSDIVTQFDIQCSILSLHTFVELDFSFTCQSADSCI